MQSRSPFALLVLAVLAILAIAWGAGRAHAYPFGWKAMVTPATMLYKAGLVDSPNYGTPRIEGEKAEFATNVMHFDLYLSEMLRDENLIEWLNFQKQSTTIIPVASAQFYVRYSVQATRAKKPKLRVITSGDAPPVPKALRMLFPQINNESRIGLLEMGVDEIRASWNPYRWLFEEQGVIIEKDWSWESILPRVILVIGIVAILLLIVELLRILALIGARAVGGVQRLVTGKRREEGKRGRSAARSPRAG